MRRAWIIGILAGLFVVVGVVAGILAVFLGRDDADSSALPPTALLLETHEWHAGLPGIDQASVRTGSHKGLSGETITTRSWTVKASYGTVVVRQYVQRQDGWRRAREVFADEDPGPVFREKLGAVDKLAVTTAPHADEAAGYCVPRAPTCSIIRYRMRYGEYVVDFSLANGEFSAASGEAMLKTLDSVVASRLS